MFEQVASEIHNIENCVNFQIEHGDRNKAKHYSRISFNASSAMGFERQKCSLMDDKLHMGTIEEVVHEGNSSRNISHASAQSKKYNSLSSCSQEFSSSSSSGSFKDKSDSHSAKTSKTTPVLDGS